MSNITQRSVFNSDTVHIAEHITNNTDLHDYYIMLGTSTCHWKSHQHFSHAVMLKCDDNTAVTIALPSTDIAAPQSDIILHHIADTM